MFCEIRIKGHLSPAWHDWLDGLTLTGTESGETLLSGYVADQAALHAVLNRLQALNVSLVSIHCVPAEQQTGSSSRGSGEADDGL